MKTTMKNLTIRLPEDLRQEIAARADSEQRSLCQVIERALRDYFTNTNGKKKR